MANPRGGGAVVLRNAGRMAVGHIRRSQTGSAALGGGFGKRAVTAVRPAGVDFWQVGHGKAFTADEVSGESVAEATPA
ncbi:hypothetical protein LZ189_14715 [Rhodovulum sulfidophilum]|nr:hypothetical protein [Rhodovulum sulfidophilum]